MELRRRKTFSGNYPQFGQAPSKRLASSALGQQILKGHQIISLPGVPCLGPTIWLLHAGKCHDPQSKFLNYTKRHAMLMDESLWTVVFKISRYIALSPLFVGYTTLKTGCTKDPQSFQLVKVNTERQLAKISRRCCQAAAIIFRFLDYPQKQEVSTLRSL
jgi:hypothetical protein